MISDGIADANVLPWSAGSVLISQLDVLILRL